MVLEKDTTANSSKSFSGGAVGNNVGVAIDKDKSSQYALKWAIENLISRGQTISLIHVKKRPSVPLSGGNHMSLPDFSDLGMTKAAKNINTDSQITELFLAFRAFCSRKDIKCNEIILEDADIARALCDYGRIHMIDVFVLGAPAKSSFVRFKGPDVPATVTRLAPEYCSVYTVSKGKTLSIRQATVQVPGTSSRASTNSYENNTVATSNTLQDSRTINNRVARGSEPPVSTNRATNVPTGESTGFTPPRISSDYQDEIKSPFDRNNKNPNRASYCNLDIGGSDISFVGSNRPNSNNDMYNGSNFNMHEEIPSRLSNSSNDYEYYNGFTSPLPPMKEKSPDNSYTLSSDHSDESSQPAPQNVSEMEAEMRRLKKELQQTIDMYSSACKEALSAKQKATELNQWKMQEHQRLVEAKKSEGAALAMAQREKEKTKAAIEAAEASKRVAEHEAHKRIMAEMMVMKETDVKKGPSMSHGDTRYRKYSINEIELATDNFDNSRKIGEGGYGPVFKCSLDHTPVAVKVLRPDAAQGRSQFNQEVEVLCCIRHPNMVLLLGACPEYGCLVYEYMANGSLEDRLFCRGKSPVLSWQVRFRIAAEIATGLLFLHQTKPEPLVHRDLKPGNILLDRNFVSKISDVGLARLVPPTVANNVTQYRMTSTAGTFCYIDPEYQQTGMLGIKSDIYSLGIMLLQIVTAKPPMGLAHQVEMAIERGDFAEMLDPAVQDWPVEEATMFAKMALKCAELRRKDRPDLKMDILPELNRLRVFSEETMPAYSMGSGNSQTSMMSMSLNSSAAMSSQGSDRSDAYRSYGHRQ